MNSIFHHVSIRKYKNQPVEKEKILRILKAGMQSPSAWNQQPWEFYVVTNKEKRKHQTTTGKAAAWRRTLWIDMDSIKIHILEFKRKHRISGERNSKS